MFMALESPAALIQGHKQLLIIITLILTELPQAATTAVLAIMLQGYCVIYFL